MNWNKIEKIRRNSWIQIPGTISEVIFGIISKVIPGQMPKIKPKKIPKEFLEKYLLNS